MTGEKLPDDLSTNWLCFFELLVVWMRRLRYLTDMGNLQNHVSRLNNRGEGESVAVNTLKIQVLSLS